MKFDAKFNNELDFIQGNSTEFDLSFEDSVKCYNKHKNHFFPDPVTATPEQRKTAEERIRDWINTLGPGQEAPVSEGVIIAGLDPTNRSHQHTVRKFMLSTGLVERLPAQDARIIKRLTNGNTAPSADDTTAPSADD